MLKLQNRVRIARDRRMLVSNFFLKYFWLGILFYVRWILNPMCLMRHSHDDTFALFGGMRCFLKLVSVPFVLKSDWTK